MARIPYPNLEDLPEKVRVAAEKLPPLNIMKMFLNAPTNAIPLLSFGQSILTKQELDAQLRELAILRVAHLTGANYEWTQHVPLAKETGVTDAQVEAIRHGADGAGADAFNEVEKRVLRFTDEVTQDVKASAETFSALEKDLGPRQMVELALAIGFYGMVARVMESFEVELEPTAGTYSICTAPALRSIGQVNPGNFPALEETSLGFLLCLEVCDMGINVLVQPGDINPV